MEVAGFEQPSPTNFTALDQEANTGLGGGTERKVFGGWRAGTEVRGFCTAFADPLEKMLAKSSWDSLRGKSYTLSYKNGKISVINDENKKRQ